MFHTKIPRRKSHRIMIGNVAVGGDAPISVQTMTNTEACNVDATVAQIEKVAKVGADIVCVSVPTMAAAKPSVKSGNAR
jgi:(E)-4-hydroxy-3-methylbut-2-enyl-diphosphate synthase